jgi:nitrogen fixation NifU-like protein
MSYQDDPDTHIDLSNQANVRDILAGSGYSDKAIEYYVNQPAMGCLDDANQISELTGHCGDTMKIYLKIDENRIQDAKIQVLGCPGPWHRPWRPWK